MFKQYPLYKFVLAGCDYVALTSGLVRFQWTDATRAWFARRFVTVIPDVAGHPVHAYTEHQHSA